LDYLQNWENDDFVRSHSVMLDIPGESLYLFRTRSEWRVFYTVDQQSKTVSVVDIATRDTILASGSVSAEAS
jgi:mRNA-degrading endonuclease RelE of RelBE toxin-antitoxin system